MPIKNSVGGKNAIRERSGLFDKNALVERKQFTDND